MADREPGWIRKLLPFLFRHKPSLVLTFGAALSGMLAQALSPIVMRTIVDDAILHRHRPLGPLLLVLVGLGVFRFGIGFVRRYFGSKVGVAVDFDLRNAIYDHLMRLDFTRHDQMQTGQLVSRANTDVNILQRLFTFLPIMSSNFLLFPVSLGFMVSISPPLTLLALVIVPVFLWITIHMRKVVYPSSWDASARAAEVANVVDEAVTGVRIVKGFGQERRELRRLADAAEHLFGSRMRNIRMTAKRQATLMVVPVLGQGGVLALGGWLAIEGRLSTGSFLAFLTYLAQLIAPIGMMAGMLVMAQTARASAERINEILDSTPEVVEPPDAMELAILEGGIELDDVTFGYVRSQPVLEGFSLTVAPGETVALVGASGSGKSTVALLLPRFYDVQEGAVRIDGVDVRGVGLDSLRRQIGVVFEDSFLFSDSIRANIAYGRPDASPAEVEAAARAAEAHRFIEQLPEGYDTVVGERGLSLSGGQRQRIALARAILADPRILLLDDATSSIDVKVEEEIHRALRTLMRGRTTIVIAHRRSSLELADRIVVVSGGKAVDEGTHDELLARCAVYRMLLSGPDEDIDTLKADVARERGAAATAITAAVPAGTVRAAATVAPTPALVAVRGPGAGGLGLNMGIGGGGFALGGPAGVRAFGLPPDELAARIEALPPIVDEPDIDIEAEGRDHGGFALRSFLRPYRRVLVLGLVLVALDALSSLAGPYIIRRGIDHGVVGRDLGSLWLASAMFFGAAIVSRTLSWTADVYTGRTGQKLLLALRIRVFSQLQRLGLDFYDREMAGRVMTRMTSDIEAMNSLLQSGLITSLVQIVTFVGSAAILLSMNVRLALVVLTIVPPLGIATALYRRRSNDAYARVREGVAAVNANFQESISGVRVAQAFNREGRNSESFRQVTGDYLGARLDSQRISSVYFPFVELMSVAANVLVLGVGAHLVQDGSLSPGALIAFSLYINTVFSPIQQLSSLFDTYQQARAAMTKLSELLGTRTSIPEATSPIVPGRLTGAVRFEGVHFSYPTAARPALQGVDLELHPGEVVALVGETGAGKSTIVKLLARFYDPTEGRVLVDGLPLADLQIEGFRRQLGYVPQEAFLFSGTIHDNIAYGSPDASRATVEEAARAVGADDFIDALPDGYDTTVTERGRSLSAGQRQLIALARALLVDPAILILDEATANLDLATEARVNRAMGVVAEGRTTVLIAHRLPTAHQASRILVVDDGQVVEDGAPDELLTRSDGAYADLWRIYHGAKLPA
jgi:ATP-binding cassette subfamily B protein